ncbi:putative tRNA sulfurtransferase [Clostridia bacterium]|nr:putative tRNA sulfurtransferase [Clostridia bacterium]
MGNFERAVLIKYGEVALRKKNRGIYEKILLDAIAKNLRICGEFEIIKEQGRFLVTSADPAARWDLAEENISRVFGIAGVSPCLCMRDKSFETVKQAALAYVRGLFPARPFTFKVESMRSDKRYPRGSYEISSDLGEYILNEMKNAEVNVHTPDLILRVEIRTKAYVYSKTNKGGGGLPPSSSGKAVLLLSGGFDSPVAGYLAAKRGMALTAVYFHSPPYTSERAKEKVKDLAERLSYFCGKVKLAVVPFTETQLLLKDHTPPEKMTILLKRAMLKISESIAEKEGALVLVTGDSVGQVASQTLRSIVTTSAAVKMPIIRPLACFDKQEIMDLAKKIGTHDISARPYEDCCTIFVADHPETKPKTSIIESIEGHVKDLPECMNRAVENTEYFEYD